MTDQELMQQALDVLSCFVEYDFKGNPINIQSIEAHNMMEALRARLAQPEQEPVAWRTFDGEGGYEYRSYEMNENYAEEWNKRNPNHKGWVEPLYTAPPQREWQGLTDEEAEHIYGEYWDDPSMFIEVIEAKLKEKNT